MRKKIFYNESLEVHLHDNCKYVHIRGGDIPFIHFLLLAISFLVCLRVVSYQEYCFKIISVYSKLFPT